MHVQRQKIVSFEDFFLNSVKNKPDAILLA